ncbi:efflux RND transporter periplasmic adaptor subunit [Jiella sp. MQZ9-1]|uniref:Efflux RND transporter periplasmic adaptor subunit n=1 Tax=Jiella flava TaxID=2816857 RepID=A0A939JVA2_9HYPH|nr:efflux RND transporter periplasmic adaptor subunit [Jiella flava]MBO0663995.1 efflux RND transporter periplasmic adaptor subunit [Jiella flava]MCD2472566.1 efflux RND transporter periplasmic adaptor subunit [Jiella flava]
MAIVRQILVTVIVLIGMGAAYLKLQPAAGQALLASGLSLPDPMRRAITWLAPAPRDVATATRSGRGRHGFADGPQLVVANPVETGRTRTAMRAIGTGEAARSVTVYPDNTTGIIERVAVKSGDQVAAGEPLVVLEHTTEELAVDRARIALDAAEAKLSRYQTLNKSRTISSVEVNDVLRERDNAKIDLRSAELALAKRTIRAPIAGRIGIVSVNVGDLVNTQTVIAKVDDRQEIKVVFYTPESFVSELKIGAPVRAVPTAQPDKTFNGHISAIDSRLDEASRTLRTEAMIDNSADSLRPGMSFTVSLSLDGEEYLSVDPLSVVWERNGPLVWKIVDGKAQKAPVTIVERNIDRVLVASQALKVGDPVVVEGLQSMRPGVKVRIEGQTPETQSPVAGAAGRRQDAAKAETGQDKRSAAEAVGGGTRLVDAAAAHEIPARDAQNERPATDRE